MIFADRLHISIILGDIKDLTSDAIKSAAIGADPEAPLAING